MTNQPKKVLDLAESDLDGDQLISVKLVRKSGQTMLYVKADEKVADMMQNGNPRDSTSWGTEYTDGDGGYQFHSNSYDNEGIRELTRDYYDSYGSSSWMNNGKGNIAVLRTVGIEEGKYFDLSGAALTEENLKQLVKDIKEFVDELRSNFLKDVAVIGEIREVEIDNTVQTAFGGDEG